MITFEHTVPLGVLILVMLLAIPLAGYTAWKFLPRNRFSIAITLLHLAALAGVEMLRSRELATSLDGAHSS